MMDDNKRKATDILIALEQKVDLALGLLKNIDMKLGLLLQKSNPKVDVSAESFPQVKVVNRDVSKQTTTMVTQKILYPGGDVVKLAKVEILDINGQVVSKTITDQIGKWKVSLSPGTYTVHVAKAPIQGKGLINIKYEVVVTDQKLLELADKKV